MKLSSVAPLAGAWIEIFSDLEEFDEIVDVAPLAGAWIEIGELNVFFFGVFGRSPRGSVD